MSLYKLLINSFKIKFFIVCFCCVSFQTVQAKKIIADGYYINQKGDTVRVRFLVPLMNVKMVDTVDTVNSSKQLDDVYTSYINVKKPDQKKIQGGIIIINEVGKEEGLIPSHCNIFK